MTENRKGHTNKQLLVKGLKRLAFGIPLIVLSTYLITFAILNKENIPIYIFLTLGIIAMIFTIYLLFMGLRLVIKSIFHS